MNPKTLTLQPEAPLLRRPGVSELYRPVLLERHLFPAMAEAVSTLLGIPVGFIPGSVVGARWVSGAPGPGAWAVGRILVNHGSNTWPAFLIQPLDVALEWGAIGLRRPPAGRERLRFDGTGCLVLTDINQQDLSAYAELCNVVACGVLARMWEEHLEGDLFVVLEEVIGVDGQNPPEGLRVDGLAAVQGLFGYQERPAPPKAGPADLERRTAWLLVLPEDLAVEVLWMKTDSNARQKTEWLLTTGAWRRR